MSLTAYSSLQTVQAPDAQNAPPSFLELASGKILFFYSPGTSHTSVDANLAVKSATSEAAANAGTFSSATTLDTYDGTWAYGNGQACQIQEGPNRGRVILISAKARRSPNIWEVYVRYSDDDGVTWSTPVEIPSVFDGGYSVLTNIKGMGVVTPPVERPGTNGQELYLPVLGFDSDQANEYSKLIVSTDGGSTWSLRSTIHDGAGPVIDTSPSEPTAAIIRTSSGALRLMVGVNMWPTHVYVKWSDDWGYTWSHVGNGVTVASNAIAPPALVQARDGSIVAIYRNLASSENTWLKRSTDYGATWGSATALDTNGRYRYGNWGTLLSGRIGLCYATETTVPSSTEAGVYWKSFYQPRFASGAHGRRRGVTRTRL